MIVNFGVGCFQFIPIRFDGVDRRLVNPHEWQKEVNSGLSKLLSATNLVVHITGISGKFRERADLLASDDKFDIDFDPAPHRGSEVSFDIVIPKRLHRELPSALFTEILSSESFRVQSLVGLHGPVTFIQCHGSDQAEESPSTAVVIVREFLEQELSRTGGRVRVETTAPSPFHADMHLAPRPSNAASDVTLEWKEARTGDDVTFYYQSDQEDASQAYEALCSTLVDDFSLYYSTVRSGDRRGRRSEIVFAMAKRLIEIYSARGIKGWFGRLFRSGKLARTLLLATISAKWINAQEVRETIKEPPMIPSGIVALQMKLNLETQRDSAELLEMVQESARLIEGTRSKSFELLVLASATLLGGAAGAIAAIIASP